MQHVVFLVILLLTSAASADDWPWWRGPQRDGISAETEWNSDWPEGGPPVVWRAEVGTGYSATVVAAGRLYTNGNRDNTDTVVCLDALTGEPRWKHSYPSAVDARFFEGGSTSTPTVDEGRVYVIGRQGDVFCLDAATGDAVWSQNVHELTGARIPGWGFGGSPVVHEHLLLLTVGGAGTALDKRTGKLIWTSDTGEAGYATPVLLRRDERWCGLFASGKTFSLVDVTTGETLWQHRWLTRFGCNAADPLVAGDFVLLSSGYNRGAALLKLTGGDPEVVWSHKSFQNQMHSSVLLEGFVYGFDGNDNAPVQLKCLELSTGEIRWEQDWSGMGSLIAAGERLLAMSEDGTLIVAAASPAAYREFARAKILPPTCWTAPTLAGGRIYCRNAAGELVCVNVRR